MNPSFATLLPLIWMLGFMLLLGLCAWLDRI